MAYKNYTHIDLTYLYDMSDNDNQFVIEIMKIFIEQVPGELDKLAVAIEGQEWSSVHSIVHKLKSSVNHVGIKSIVPIIQQIESSTHDLVNLDTIQSKYLQIKTVCYAAIEELKSESKWLAEN